MTQNADSRQLDEEAYRYYLHDGLHDVLAGLSLLFAVLYLFADLSAAFVALWVVLLLPMWASARRSIVAPHVRHMHVSPEQSARARRVGVLLVVIVVGILLLAVVAGADLFVGQQTGWIPDWLHAWLSRYLILALGLLAAIILGMAARLSGLKRLYGYGIVTLAVFGVCYFVNVPIPFAAAVVGGVVTLWGLVMLIDFVRRHPARQA